MLKNIFIKNKQIILYLVFGVLTTLVNFIVYAILSKIFYVDKLISNAIAWIVSVLFAYFTNKVYVFESKKTGFRSIFFELISFIGCRIFSGFVDMAVMYIGIYLLYINDIITKIISNVIVVILNYFFSKLYIFKNKE